LEQEAKEVKEVEEVEDKSDAAHDLILGHLPEARNRF
jgi:hypothetical protein